MARAKDEVQACITAAARARFSHYGYAKTTMAELAADCGMSPGNLYRFFPGKLDIAEAIAREDEAERIVALDRLVAAPARPAREKLRDYLFAELRTTYCKFEDEPEALEIARLISQDRPEFGERRVAAERGLIARILREGVAAGELSVEDCDYMAEMIHSATLKFRFPQRWTHSPLETLERELDGVFVLMTDGLTPRAG